MTCRCNPFSVTHDADCPVQPNAPLNAELERAGGSPEVTDGTTTGDNVNSDVESSPRVERPEPTTLTEALARLNTTPEEAWDLASRAKWGFSNGDDCPYEYDQGHMLEVGYDTLYDLASIALAAMKLLR